MIRVYLSGPIEYSKDHGVSWRIKATKIAESLGNGIEVLNPIEFNRVLDEENKSVREKKDWHDPAFRRYMSKIINRDMSSAQACDVTLVKWESGPVSAGTVSEMTGAFRAGKPVLLVKSNKVKISDIPGWALGTITEFHETLEEAFFSINSGELWKVPEEEESLAPKP